VICLVTFAVIQGKEHRMLGKVMKGKLEKACKEAVMESKALRKTTKIQDKKFPDRDSN
jgi:hypothetical protein